MSQKNTGAKEFVEKELKRAQDKYQKLNKRIKEVSDKIGELVKKLYR